MTSYYDAWMINRHDEEVTAISSTIRQFHEDKVPFRIYHGSTNSTRQSSFQRDKMVNTSRLNCVVKVDVDAKTVLVEPNVPMDKLVEATLEHGLIPPVVMEFPGITVGGGFAGTAGESSSFKYGFFDNTVNWVEIVLANGDIVKASDKENSDLFYGAGGTFGTLGVTTLLELRLIEARRFVQLTYVPITSVRDAVLKIESAIKDPSNDFVDGILFSQHRGVIMKGALTNLIGDGWDDENNQNITLQSFSGARDPWFYLHAESLLNASSTESTTIAIPLKDYLFRYDRGAFWTGRYAFKYFLTPFNRITRFLLDPLMHTRVMYRALHASGMSSSYIIQDMALPASKTKDFVTYLDTALGIYPLWLCPLRRGHNISMHPLPSLPVVAKPTKSRSKPSTSLQPPKTTETLINIGIWGPGPRRHDRFIQANKALETQLKALGGLKWLYAQTYYSETEFWEIYDRKWYEALREKWRATGLPSVWEKVKTSELDEQGAGVWRIWPLRGVWGVLAAVLGGGEYLVDGGAWGVLRALGVVVLFLAFLGAFYLNWRSERERSV